MTRLKLTIDRPERNDRREILVERFPFHIGRALRNDLPLLSPSVSSEHLIIDWDSGQLMVTDLNSTNGTRVGDRRLSPHQAVAVELPASVRIGDVAVQVCATESCETLFTMAESATRVREMVDEVVRESNARDETQPFFEILSGPGSGRRFSMEPEADQKSIGTDEDCDIYLALSELSGPLATVVWDDSHCWLIPDEAVVEYNGTALDERRRLVSGDRFVIGSAELLYYDPLEDALASLESTDDQRRTIPTTDAAGNDDDGDSDAEQISQQMPAAPEPTPATAQPITDDGPAEFGAIEVILLAMSVVFLLGTIALLIVVFAP